MASEKLAKRYIKETQAISGIAFDGSRVYVVREADCDG